MEDLGGVFIEKRGKDIKMLTAQKNVLCLCKLMTSLTSVSNPFSFIVSMVSRHCNDGRIQFKISGSVSYPRQYYNIYGWS